MSEHEQFVREAWEIVQFYAGSRLISIWFDGPASEPKTFGNWSAAASFTRERQKQIREVEEEIAWLCVADFSGPDGEVSDKAAAAQDRILAARQAALAELKRGVK